MGLPYSLGQRFIIYQPLFRFYLGWIVLVHELDSVQISQLLDFGEERKEENNINVFSGNGPPSTSKSKR